MKKFIMTLAENLLNIKQSVLAAATAAQPMVLADNLIVNDIVMEGKRPFYDTSWLLNIGNAGRLQAVRIIRDDDENLSHFRALVQQARSVADLRNLDRRDSIYYD